MLKKKLTEKIKDCAIYSTGEGTNSYLLSDEQAEQILHTVIDEIKKKLPKEKKHTKRCKDNQDFWDASKESVGLFCICGAESWNDYKEEILTLLNQMKGEK